MIFPLRCSSPNLSETISYTLNILSQVVIGPMLQASKRFITPDYVDLEREDSHVVFFGFKQFYLII